MLLQLQQAVKSGLLAHAYLFIGNKITTMDNAVELAQTVNCPGTVDGQACRKCLSCSKIRHGNHPDVLVIEPKGASFKIEQVRDLHRKVSYRHYEGRYKVLILSGADLMTPEAANSLLKILEEPPGNTIFILLAEKGDNILLTVHSRCQVIKFSLGQDETGGENFADEVDQQVGELLQGMALMDDDRLLRLSEMWEKNKENTKMLLERLFLSFRDIAVAKLTGEQTLVQNQKIRAQIGQIPLGAETALLAAREVQSSQRMIRQNVNFRLVIDVMLLKLSRLAR